MRPKTRIMYIENKEGDPTGSARIGRIRYSKSGSSIHYNGKTFLTQKGDGIRGNFIDVETDEEYWISGCHKDGKDALYTTDVTIDSDVLEEYWITIRNLPEKKHLSNNFAVKNNNKKIK